MQILLKMALSNIYRMLDTSVVHENNRQRKSIKDQLSRTKDLRQT